MEVERKLREEQELAAALLQRKADKRAALKPEPDASASDSTLVRVRLPNGSNAQRRFATAQVPVRQSVHPAACNPTRHQRGLALNPKP
jgi:hypothetical protein